MYTHGYLAQTLGTRDTPPYLSRLTHVDERNLQHTFSTDWPDAFFITNPIIPNVHPSVYIAGRPAWLLDYVLRDYGTVVPQRIWSPGTPSDAQRYNNVTLNLPIFFVENDRRALGLSLIHAAAGDTMRLLDARATAPVGHCHTTSIRIKVSIFQRRNLCKD
jgi:hypothetical protein